jgi:hypothetical protein
MNLQDLEREVRLRMDEARDALGRIEMEVRETGEAPDLMAASRVYAQFCMHARDLLGGIQMRRAFPQRFADRVEALRDELVTHRGGIDRMDLHPSPEEFGRLAQAARDAPASY